MTTSTVFLITNSSLSSRSIAEASRMAHKGFSASLKCVSLKVVARGRRFFKTT